MGLFVCSLNSGSNGNCYYIGDHEQAILVDAGISRKETEKRLAGAGLDISRVKAVFISHEHHDHISGLPALATKYRLPVFANKKTARHLHAIRDEGLLQIFEKTDNVRIGELTITAFSKFHDADDPVSFTVSRQGIHVGVYTDIGMACNNLKAHFNTCHAAFLESNYDEEMLMNGNYPAYLKKRISGDKGHLSNDAALDLFKSHRPAHMSHLILAHLSAENNCAEKVKEAFEKHSVNTEIIVAGRSGPTPVFHITGRPIIMAQSAVASQLSIF